MYICTYIEREREREGEIQYGIITHIEICIYMHIYIYTSVYVEHIYRFNMICIYRSIQRERERYIHVYKYICKQMCIYMYISNILLSNYVTWPTPQPPHSMSPLPDEVMAWTHVMDRCLIVCHLTTLLASGVGCLQSTCICIGTVYFLLATPCLDKACSRLVID